jgi:hypothetical protein
LAIFLLIRDQDVRQAPANYIANLFGMESYLSVAVLEAECPGMGSGGFLATAEMGTDGQ